MEWITYLFERLYDVPGIVKAGGLVGIWAIVFAETGLMVGFFLPGDSLLVTAGLFAAQGLFDIWLLMIGTSIAAIVGDATGYAIGRRLGEALYSRPNSRFFRREHLIRTKEFYDRHGGKTIVIARFMPIVRTFAPVVAGAAEMRYSSFALYNVSGGILWVFSMSLTGYFLGQIAGVEKHLHLIVMVVIGLSLLPAVISYLRERYARA